MVHSLNAREVEVFFFAFKGLLCSGELRHTLLAPFHCLDVTG